MDRGFTVLTVCEGNIHRSAMAGALLERWAQWYPPSAVAAHLTVASAGLGARPGEPMGSRTRALVRLLGVDGTGHRATRLTDAMISGAGLILTGSAEQRDRVIARVPSALRRTFAIREAGRAAQHLSLLAPVEHPAELAHHVELMAANRVAGESDIIDPHRRDNDAFVRMVGEEVPPLAWIARLLLKMPQAEVAEYERIAADVPALEALLAAVAPSHAAGRAPSRSRRA